MATSKIPLVPGTKTLARGSVVIGCKWRTVSFSYWF